MTARPWVLGISCSHNSAACLLHGDEIVAAIQDERLLRAKRYETHARFVSHSIAYCLEAGGIRPSEIDLVVYSVTHGNTGDDRHDIFLNEALRAGRDRLPIVAIPHHYAHAVSAFATSGFPEAAILVVDGSGTHVEHLPPDERAVVLNPAARAHEWLSYYEACGTQLTPIAKQVAAHVGDSPSLGDMYGSIGEHLFGHFFEGAGKMLGLAAYGRAIRAVDEWVSIRGDGVIRLHADAIRRAAARCAWPADFQECTDLAAMAQAVVEHALTRTVEWMRARSPSANLCYAGGAALNSVADELDGCVFQDRIIHKASDFTSILDLCPRLTASSITIDMPIVNGSIVCALDGTPLEASPVQPALVPFHADDLRRRRDRGQRDGRMTRAVAHATAETRWGQAKVPLNEEYWNLLMHIDGNTDGHALRKTGRGWSEGRLLHAMAALYRASLIGLPPQPGNESFAAVSGGAGVSDRSPCAGNAA